MSPNAANCHRKLMMGTLQGIEAVATECLLQSPFPCSLKYPQMSLAIPTELTLPP